MSKPRDWSWLAWALPAALLALAYLVTGAVAAGSPGFAAGMAVGLLYGAGAVTCAWAFCTWCAARRFDAAHRKAVAQSRELTGKFMAEHRAQMERSNPALAARIAEQHGWPDAL